MAKHFKYSILSIINYFWLYMLLIILQLINIKIDLILIIFLLHKIHLQIYSYQFMIFNHYNLSKTLKINLLSNYYIFILNLALFM